MKNIVLIGFMGTGKTTVAKECAVRLDMEYVSTDLLIEKLEGRLIKDIFGKEGEDYFRKVEKDIVKEVSSRKGIVVDSGGGVVLDSENLDNLKVGGVVICLEARPEVILKRTKGYGHRPLLNVPDPLAKIKELLDYRAPFYAKADKFIDTSDKDINSIVEELKHYVEE